MRNIDVKMSELLNRYYNHENWEEFDRPVFVMGYDTFRGRFMRSRAGLDYLKG